MEDNVTRYNMMEHHTILDKTSLHIIFNYNDLNYHLRATYFDSHHIASMLTQCYFLIIWPIGRYQYQSNEYPSYVSLSDCLTACLISCLSISHYVCLSVGVSAILFAWVCVCESHVLFDPSIYSFIYLPAIVSACFLPKYLRLHIEWFS